MVCVVCWRGGGGILTLKIYLLPPFLMQNIASCPRLIQAVEKVREVQILQTKKLTSWLNLGLNLLGDFLT